jgi:ferredoxin
MSDEALPTDTDTGPEASLLVVDGDEAQETLAAAIQVVSTDGDDAEPEAPQMKDHVLMVRTRCQHHAWEPSGCTHCLDVCPVDAITVTPNLSLDQTACIHCGLCAAVCPTDGVSSSSFPPYGAYTRIKARGEQDGIDTLYLTCSQTDVDGASDSVFTVPCLGIIPPETWFALCSEFDVRVYLPDGLCLDCIAPAGADLMFGSVEKAQEWLEAEIPLEGSWHELEIPETGHHGKDRRDFLRMLAMRVGKASTGNETIAVRKMKAKQERVTSLGAILATEDTEANRALPEGSAKRVVTGQRRHLLNLLGQHEECLATLDTPTVVTGPDCIVCGDCVPLCPVGARLWDRTDEEHPRIVTDVRHCIDCTRCLEVCTHGGLVHTVSKGTELIVGLPELAQAEEEKREEKEHKRAERDAQAAERRRKSQQEREERQAKAQTDAEESRKRAKELAEERKRTEAENAGKVPLADEEPETKV